jgi:thiamine-phosphate pyrophosphorylase
MFPITDVTMSGRSHLDQVTLLVAAGARLIEVREKHRAPGEMEEEFRACVAVCRAAGATLIVNDFVELAARIGADGVHVGQGDISPTEARRIIGPDMLLGVSTHSREQFLAALDEPVDYIAVGPVFGTTTKANPDPMVGVDLVEFAAKQLAGRLPLVAIGGIDGGNIGEVVRAAEGSGTVVVPSVIGAVWKGADPAANFRALAELLKG